MAFGDIGSPVTALGRAAAATFALRIRSELRVVVVVKATFAFVQDGPMKQIDPDAIVRADTYRDDDVSKSLVAASDLTPFRPRADVTLVGHGRAPHGRPVPAMAARLVLAQGPTVVLDKRLSLRGPPDVSGRTREPIPFAVMPLLWELARKTPENPVGIAEDADEWAHIVDGLHQTRAAGFGPLSPRWPTRRRLLTDGEGAFATAIPALTGDMSWTYFNAAPEDQRIPFLRGDEWVGLEGMHAEIPRVQSCLPGARAAARVFGAGAGAAAGMGAAVEGGRPLRLEADTLLIDADRQVCSVVWRGGFRINSEDDLAAMHIFAGVEMPGAPLAFPASYKVPAPKPSTAPVAPLAPGARPVLPFSPPPQATHPTSPPQPTRPPQPTNPPQATRPPQPTNPPQATRPPQPTRPPDQAQAAGVSRATMALDVETLLERRPVVPFGQQPSSPTAPAKAADPSAPPVRAATMAIDISSLPDLAAAMPFTGAPSAEPVIPHGPLPAATPFEHGPIAPPPMSESPATLDLRKSPDAPPLRIGISQDLLPASPAQPSPPPPLTATPSPLPSEPPKTLGAFFLAALARSEPRPAAIRATSRELRG